MKYCDYDAIVIYAPGSFNHKYKTDISDKIRYIDKKELPHGIAVTFMDEKYSTVCCIQDIILYRVFGCFYKQNGSAAGAKIIGSYASTEFAESIIDVKCRLALLPEWGNTKMFEAKFCVPRGTVLNVGIVASQPPDKKTFIGGAEQIILPYPLSKEEWDSWVIGYRRVTTRQLNKCPNYPFKTIDEVVERDKLYPITCPDCGCDNIVKIPKEDREKYIFIGSKGRKYFMQYKCMNQECEYVW